MNEETKFQPAVRLALRVEGEMWNAYIADMHNMEGAFLVGSIAMAAVANNERRKKAFINMMKGVLADALNDVVGIKPKRFTMRQAPESEMKR